MEGELEEEGCSGTMSFVPTQFASFTFNKDSTGAVDTFTQMKGVNDFFDRARCNAPAGWLDWQSRITYNLSYFKSNYLVLATVLYLYCVFTNFYFFLCLLLEAVVVYYVQSAYGNTDELNLRLFSLHRNIWYSLLLMFNIPFLLLYSPLASVLWMTLASVLLIAIHASFLDKPVDSNYSDAV